MINVVETYLHHAPNDLMESSTSLRFRVGEFKSYEIM